jgi:hypothetical protein
MQCTGGTLEALGHLAVSQEVSEPGMTRCFESANFEGKSHAVLA